MTAISYKIVNVAGKAPTRAHSTDAGFDLYAAQALVLGPGERTAVATGIALAIPAGMAGLVLPRSGLAIKHGITCANSPGLIDPDYRGEVKVLLLNTDRHTEFKVEVGDRIAQLVLVSLPEVSFHESDRLQATTRGSDGFGSTGS